MIQPDAADELCIGFADERIRVVSFTPHRLDILAAHLRHCTQGVGECRRAQSMVLLADSLPDDLVLNEIIAQLIAPCAAALVLHAAGVTLKNRGIMLAGVSGSGKSTLTAWLVRSGFGYLSDEVIAVSGDGTPMMRGFARSLVLKAGSAHIWRPLIDETARVRHFGDGSAWIPPEVLNSTCVSSSAALDVIIFPRYDPTVLFEVEQLSPAQTAFNLMQNLVNARNLPRYGLSALAAVAKAAPGYALVYSDVTRVSTWLLNAL